MRQPVSQVRVPLINTLPADISYFDEDLLKNQSTLMFTFTSGRLDNSSVRSANTCWASAVASKVSVSSEKTNTKSAKFSTVSKF